MTNFAEFIEKLIDKKSIDREIIELSKNINDFPLAYQILNKIDGSDFIRTILNPKNIGEIELAAGDLKRHCFIDNGALKQAGYKFIEELVIQAKIKFNFSRFSLKNDNNEIIIGIDLGTTNSVVAFCEKKNDNAKVIPLNSGRRLLPSVVSISKNTKKFTVGESALNQKITNPEETFYSIKRFIGRSSKEFKKIFLDNYPFNKIIREDRLVLFSQILNQEFSCEELSAQVLMKLRINAEKYLNTKIKKCVITVPAYFDNNQRKATKVAAEIAGLEVIRLINEPTAAALAYSIDKSETELNTLVFDLGGGTFDISLVRTGGEDIDSFSVISTQGDRELGGDDYSNLLYNHFVKIIKDRNSNVVFDDIRNKGLIRDEVEKVKHQLSFEDKVDINIPFLFTKDNVPFSYQSTITISEFNRVIDPLTKRIEKIIRRFLKLKLVKSNRFSKVVLVGGASRMPSFVNLVQEMTGLIPMQDHNPDEIVALGAAYCAEYNDKKVIIDVNPLSLGIKLVGDIFSILIPSNALLPTRKSGDYTTVEDYQKRILFEVFQGEREIASKNINLGKFILDDVLIAERNVPNIDVTFEMDCDGILNVKAKDMDTNARNSIVIRNTLDISPQEIKRMRQIAFDMFETDKKYLGHNLRSNDLLNDLLNWKKVFDDIHDPKLSSVDKNIIKRVEDALESKSTSSEDIECLTRSLQIIIKEQERFSSNIFY